MRKVRDREVLVRKEQKEAAPELEAAQSMVPPTLEIASSSEGDADALAANAPTITQQRSQNGSFPSRKQHIEGMPIDLQDRLEATMGQDFSFVKLHANSSQASKAGALAFARGNEVHFAPGQYQPHTPQGRQLIGHEFAHLAQQRQGQVKATHAIGDLPVNDDPALEAAADAMGARVAQMGASTPGEILPSGLAGEGAAVMQMKLDPTAIEVLPTSQESAPLDDPNEKADDEAAEHEPHSDPDTADAEDAEASTAPGQAPKGHKGEAEGTNPELDTLLDEQEDQMGEVEGEQEAEGGEGRGELAGDTAQLAPDPNAGWKGLLDWGNLTYLLAPTLTLPSLAIEKLSLAASAGLEKTNAPDWLKNGVKAVGNIQGSINQAIHQYGGELFEGAVMGDFNEDPTIANMVGQVLIGLVPYAGQAADLRDTIHAVGKMTDGGWKEGGNWLNLGLTLLAWVPLLGDGVKVMSKLGKLKGVKGLLTKLEPASKAISEGWGKVTKYLAPKIDGFKQFLGKGWNDLKTAATKKFNAAKAKVMATVGKVKSGISSAWNWVKGKVAAGVDWLKGKVAEGWQKAKTMIANGTKKLSASIAKAAKTIQQKAAALPQKLLDKTKAIWEGVKSGVKAVKAKVKSSLNGIKSKFERFVGRVRQKWDEWRGKGKEQGDPKHDKRESADDKNKLSTQHGRVDQPGGHMDKHETYKNTSDVPDHYKNDPRFESLAMDPAQGNKITAKTRSEAMAGMEAESSGLVKGPISRGPKEIEFYDADGNPWDVKTPPLAKTGGRNYFDAETVGKSIKKELMDKAKTPGDPPGTYPHKTTGTPVPRKVILDSSYLNESDHKALWEWLNSNLPEEALSRIVEVVTKI